ncbi:UDP-N-acetylglucosamine--undecaprenyl-phosphate N-acetylglucosaminephosphotransferase [Serratia silvae]
MWRGFLPMLSCLIFFRDLLTVNLLTMSTEILFVFLFSLAFLFVARKAAKPIGLVDKPNYRKRHQGLIPLVGGISVYAGICFAFLITDQTIVHSKLYLTCAGVLVFVGALDDRFDISVKIRATIQALVGIAMMVFAGLYLRSLGYVFGGWEMQLGPFGYLVTLFAVWAAINAFNMVDGIDGLLGGLSCVSFGAMGILLYQGGHSELAFWCFAMLAAIVPYILLNLGILGRRYKVFMGDAGSTLIGFTAIWLLVQSSQGPSHPIKPVTALWIIAIPLMDMIAIMYRRLRKGMSPFSPDRQHIHHLIMRAGFTPRQAFVLITLAAALLAAIGVIGERLTFIPEWFMLALFLLAFFFYGYCIKRAWRVARYIKRLKRRLRNATNNKQVP